MNFMLWILSAFCDESITEIEVIGHKDIDVYVAETIIKNEYSNLNAVIGDYSIFGYTSQYKNLAQVKSDYGWITIDYSDYEIKIFNKDSIKNYWSDCDYEMNPKQCSYQNSHYLLESYITINKNQIVLEMFLYDSEMQIISTSRETSTIKINWIKQQETTVIQNSGIIQNNTTISKPKEEEPIRWEIPPMLLDKNLQQCALKLWASVKFKL